MKNYVLAGVGLLVVTAICATVIHFEAEQTRTAMRDIAREELSETVREEVDSSLKTADDGRADTQGLADKIGDTLGVRRKPDDKAGDGNASSKPDDNPQPGANPSGNVLDRMRDTVGGNAGGNAKGKEQPKIGEMKPEQLVDSVFGMAREAAKGADHFGQDYFALTQEEERTWGRKLHQQIIGQAEVIKDAALYDRIDEVTAPILRKRRRRGIDYTFTVLKSDPDDINAFSIVGGYIYINKGLIDYVKNDAELQFVLGHEIGHVDLGHCAEALTYTARASDVGTSLSGNVVGLVRDLLTRSFTQEQEFEADEYGFRASIAAGQTRDQALSFPRRFTQYLKAQGRETPRKKSDKSVLTDFMQHVDHHFSTHPEMAERVKRLEAIDLDAKPVKK